MCHAIRINQPSHIGSMVTTFEEEGKARLTVDALNAAGDPRTNAEYLGRVGRIHLTFAPTTGDNAPSLRRQAMDCFERGLPHRVAFDTVDLRATDDSFREYECYILAGWRQTEKGA